MHTIILSKLSWFGFSGKSLTAGKLATHHPPCKKSGPLPSSNYRPIGLNNYRQTLDSHLATTIATYLSTITFSASLPGRFRKEKAPIELLNLFTA
jgi:hypothetical protein